MKYKIVEFDNGKFSIRRKFFLAEADYMPNIRFFCWWRLKSLEEEYFFQSKEDAENKLKEYLASINDKPKYNKIIREWRMKS